MKNLIALLILSLMLALAGSASAACTTPPTITGVAGVWPPVGTNHVTSFYQWTTASYAMKVWWAPSQSSKVSFGSGSDITVLTGASCVASACAAWTGDPMTTLTLPETTLASGVKVISFVANGVKYAEWYNVWHWGGSFLKTSTYQWNSGMLVKISEDSASPRSKIYFDGWDLDVNGNPYHSSISAQLANACGTIF